MNREEAGRCLFFICACGRRALCRSRFGRFIHLISYIHFLESMLCCFSIKYETLWGVLKWMKNYRKN